MTSLLTTAELVALVQVILTDLALAADNAIVIGMSAAQLPPPLRRRAILLGIIGATVMRILFAAFVVQLLEIVGLLLAGGILLLWVSWKLWREIGHKELAGEALLAGHGVPIQNGKSFNQAVSQIVVADISMSLDNVLAVAGAAREHAWVLVVGLAVSIVLMGSAATCVARLLTRHSWIAYLGLLVIVFVSVDMIAAGAKEVLLAV